MFNLMEDDIQNNRQLNNESKIKGKEFLDTNTQEKNELNKNNISKVEKFDEKKEDYKAIVDSKNETTKAAPLKNTEAKPKKEIPIEKKPFEEFVNMHLIPALVEEFKNRGFEIEDINLKNTLRPIAGDKCWVIYCQIKNICNFWLSFENDDITSTKSISLTKSGQQPSIIESFLIDEKRITLKLIISRILQRLNGQKLIGVN